MILTSEVLEYPISPQSKGCICKNISNDGINLYLAEVKKTFVGFINIV